MLPADWGRGYPNVWLGTTTEDEKHYRMRWPVLAGIPAAIRFISYEPAIAALGRLNLGGPVPDWIIAGGESGPKARIMQLAWAREVRDECRELGIPFFFKQWGSRDSNPAPPEEDPTTNGKGGGLLDGFLWREFPAVTARPRRAAA
jgi:protein gp37